MFKQAHSHFFSKQSLCSKKVNFSFLTLLLSFFVFTPLAWSTPYLEINVVDAYKNPLPTFYHHGQSYVLGRHGQRYALRIKNPSSQRLEIVATVDGRDVVNGRPGKYENRGYVLMPYDELIIEGFRKNEDQVAAFRFTTPEDSYAHRMGAGTNVGLIGFAVFEERIHRRFRPHPRAQPHLYDSDHASPSLESRAELKLQETHSMPSSRSRSSSSGGYPSKKSRSSRRSPQRSDLGTQYGETRSSSSYEVRFVRRSSTPSRVYQFTYDSEAGLRRRGVLHSPAPSPSAFPAESRYAPPPP